MELIGTHIAIPWDYMIPFHYGVYKGKLKNGKDCKIDVDWKVRVYTDDNEFFGTDEIAYWLCDVNHVKAILLEFENLKH